MQPYVNPNYFMNPYYSSFGNATTPNIQNVSSLSSYQAQQLGISGKYVNDFSEITANDVPMNGSPAIFAKNDRSEIQLREWNPSGQIVSTSYKPILEQKESQTSNLSNNTQNAPYDLKTEVLEPILERLSDVEYKLDKLSKPTARTNVKKDGDQA